MPGKRIKDLTALSGAGSANDDDVVIFDTTANETKRISRSQLAEGMQADVQVLTNKTIALGSNTVTGTTAQFNTALTDNNFATQAGAEALTNKTIDSANNTLTINYKEAQVETSNGSRTHLFTTVAALLADTGTYTTYTAGQIVTAGEFRYEVAASGASDHHVTTAGGVKLYGRSGELPVLGGGTSSHSDGTNTIVGSARYFIGNATPSADDSALLIGRSLTGSYVSGAHAIRDETSYDPSGTGLYAYASFDSIPRSTGTDNWNHVRSFQARPNNSSSGVIDEVAGVHFQATTTAGTVTNMYGIRVSEPLGAGAITNFVCFFADNSIGLVSPGRLFIYSGSAALPSYHGGKWQMGTAPQITAAGFTQYGAILAHDSTGNLLSNPNLTIVNGVLDFRSATAAKVTASGVFSLELDAIGVVKALKPLTLPVYTVATLPSPASAYTYSKAFVSDASVTHTAGIGAIVAGGGANRVPVYSDGTNWRIG